jgi:hypothetical protein
MTHFFHVFIYFMSLHVSSATALIVRRSNCINTSSGIISLCKWLLGMLDWHTKQSHRIIIPDDVLIQFNLLMMGAVALETCRDMKWINTWKKCIKLVISKNFQQNAPLLNYYFKFYDVQVSYTAACKQIVPYLYIQPSYTIACKWTIHSFSILSDDRSKAYHTFMYNRLPEDEPSGSKRLEDNVKIKTLVQHNAFCWFILHGGSFTYYLLLSRSDLMSWPWKLTAFSLCCVVDGLPLHTLYCGDS